MIPHRKSIDLTKEVMMSWSTLKFVLLFIGTVFLGSSDSKAAWSQAVLPDAADLNKLQTAFDSWLGPGGAQRKAAAGNPATEKIIAAAKEIGLDGRWIVLNVEKEGELTLAQIGQKPNDVISIVPGKDSGGPLALG